MINNGTNRNNINNVHNPEAKTIRNLNIASINVNSIVRQQRRYFLQSFIDANKIDIALVGETKLNEKHTLQFDKHNIIRNDRNNSKFSGGTAIVIRKNIKYTTINYPNSMNNSALEYTIIKLKENNNKNLFIISAYATNAERRSKIFLDELSLLFNELELHKEKNYYIILGDLNARNQAYGDSKNNARGRNLRNWELANEYKFKLSIIPPENFTFIRAQTFLDLALIDCRLNITNLNNHKIKTYIYDSDHKALIITLELDPNMNIQCSNSQEEEFYIYKKTNWPKFQKELQYNYKTRIPDDKCLNNDELDQILKEITEHIQLTMETQVPKGKPSGNITKYVNKKINQLHKYKRKLLTIFNKCSKKDPNLNKPQTQYVQKLIKSCQKRLNDEFKAAIEKHWRKIYEKINYKDTSKFRPTVNKIFRKKKKQVIRELKIKTSDNSLINEAGCNSNQFPILNNEYTITNEQDISNIIGAHYQRINSPRYLNENSRFKKIVDEKTESFKKEMLTDIQNGKKIIEFTPDNLASNAKNNQIIENYFTDFITIKKTLKNLPNKISSGIDKIPPIIIKHIPDIMIRDLTILFNNALNNFYFPNEWKTALVIPIHKKGKNTTDPASYRPISMTPALSKVYEAVINNSTMFYAKKNKVLPNNQYGFRENHSAVHAVNKLTSDVNEKLFENQMVGAVLLDLEKAFDSVWINGLIYRLIEFKFPTPIIRMIWNMINNKKFRVIGNGNLISKCFDITEGLQQGTINSPCLFNIFTAHMIDAHNLNNNNNTYSIAYADDRIIYVAGKDAYDINKKLNPLIKKVNDMYSMWNLRVNPLKSETILFRNVKKNMSKKKKQVSKHSKLK